MVICGKDIHVRGRIVRIAGLAADMYEYVDNPEVTIDALRDCGVRIDLFTFMQRLPETSPKYSYPMEWDNLAVLPISTFDHWWNEQIGFKARNKAKQAEKKGVIFREVPFDSLLVQGIWAVYNECEVRQGKQFTHYGKEIEQVRLEAGTFLHRSIFIGAFLDGTLIGFVKLLYDETGTQAGLLHIVSMIKHRDKAPTNGLVAQAVRSCAQRGILYLVYSRFNDGNKKFDGLMEFKDRNGFKQVDLPRYYVPLTQFGRVALRLGFHKNVTHFIPEPILKRLRDLKSGWYMRKIKSTQQGF